MFGRGRAEDRAATAAAQPSDDDGARGGKGRPTPKRREAEQRNRRPIVDGAGLAANATKEQRKAARAARRQRVAEERARQRRALETGEEAHLPPRDQGPARRWVRDFVDARRSAGEYFLPVSFLILLLSLPTDTRIRLLSVFLLYGVLAAVIVDSFVLRRRLKRETESRFGDKAYGAAGYGMMRALQMRRFRLPRPQVARGQYPR